VEFEGSIGPLTYQQFAYALGGLIGAIAAIIFIASEIKGKQILHRAEREFLGSMTAFYVLGIYVMIPPI